MQPAVVVVEVARLVDRREHGQPERAAELEVLGAGAGGDVDDPRALLERDLVPRDDPVLDRGAGRQVVERASCSAGPASSAPGDAADEGVLREERREHPLAVLPQAVFALRMDGGGDVLRAASTGVVVQTTTYSPLWPWSRKGN